MKVLPAIDLRGGRCVRLLQGDAERETVYGEDPVAMARHWVSLGADYLHIVDLDGAFKGVPAHGNVIRKVAAEGIPFELGGGIRSEESIEAALRDGADRVILGTRAASDPSWLEQMAKKYRGRLAVGIDARDGFVRVKGWTEGSSLRAIDVAGRVAAIGIQTIIFTNISSDGMMRGIDVEGVRKVCSVFSGNVIASGGVGSVADIERLRGADLSNLFGVIVGKALYEGRVTLPALLKAAGSEGEEES